MCLFCEIRNIEYTERIRNEISINIQHNVKGSVQHYILLLLSLLFPTHNPIHFFRVNILNWH